MGSLTTALFLCLFVTMGSAGALGPFYNWEVKQELMGSYKKLVVTINGQTPGPTIQAHQGERVFIQSLGSDGTGDVLGKSQYDSYYTMQMVAGLHGLIDVLRLYGMAEPFAQDYDNSIILDYWYYKSYHDWAAEPKSLLIPRKGKFDYAESTTSGSHPTACDAINLEYPHWRVVPGKTYRLNISSVTAQSTLSFQIEPFVNQSLIVYSGKTYFIKIKANEDPSRNYSIMINIVGQNATATTPLGLAVLSYSPPAGPIRNDVTPQLVQSLVNKAAQGNIYEGLMS
ncbi:hypothetical protein ACJRO7_034047 [Eucalyptus globulus]|uniref:Plastocyanin-like domain-containing protein n=1 Tax=Eucalyptus globulus TaxID=34317 RepID=A0ABD3J5G0_EUCGL